MVYVSVYFIGALVLVASSDRWLMVPLLIWLAGYAAACWYFVPKLGKLSAAQADMRSLVTGRVVDSYTNIPTVKLFAHADREDAYASEGMGWMLDTVNASMRMSTLMTSTLQLLSGVLIFTMSAMSIWLWHQGAITTGAIAFAIGLMLRLKAMSQWIIWELAGLFEDVGVIQDGIETIARDRTIKDAEGAKPLVVTQGRHPLRQRHLQLRQARGRHKPVLANLSLSIAPGEKVGLVGRSGAGKSTLTNLLLRFYDLEKGRILIDGQDISQVTQDSLRAAIGVVTQDTSLLHRSVIDNIRYGRPDASWRRSRRRRARRMPTSSSPPSSTPRAGAATRRMWASAASSSPAASASASPSPACCSRTRRSSSSTRRRARLTRRSSRRSRKISMR